jgi:hypothetical protein
VQRSEVLVNSKLRIVVVVGAIAASALLWYSLRAYHVSGFAPSTGAKNPRENLSNGAVPGTPPTPGDLASGQWRSTALPSSEPNLNPVPGSQAVTQLRDSQVSVARRYETANDKRALFEELKASGSSDAPFFAAMILRDCLDVSVQGLNSVITDFTAKIPDNSPTKTTQIEAFRRLKEPCAGFEGRRSSLAEVEQKFSEAMRNGDPRAMARTLNTGQFDPKSDPVKLAAGLLEDNDPYVIAEVADFLEGPVAGGFVIGGMPVGPLHTAAANAAWDLVACDYGGSCGSNSGPVLTACAYSEVCGVSSLDEVMSTLYLTPDEYRRALEYRLQIEAALQSKDYSSLGLDPANRPKPKK